MDAVDRQLIQALRENGRASYAELGRLVGLSGPSVTDRINRLEAAGVITGYRATVDAASLGLGVTALIGISLSDAADHEDVARRLKDLARDRGLLVHRGRRLVHAQGPGRRRGRPGEDHPAAQRHQGRLPDPYHDRALHQVGEPGRRTARGGVTRSGTGVPRPEGGGVRGCRNDCERHERCTGMDAGLKRELEEKVRAGERLTREDGIALYESDDLAWLGGLAHEVRTRKNGDVVHFNVNRHLNMTNVCTASCAYCSFQRKPGEKDAYTMRIEEAVRLAKAMEGENLTELHIVNGLHPTLPWRYYPRSLQRAQGGAAGGLAEGVHRHRDPPLRDDLRAVGLRDPRRADRRRPGVADRRRRGDLRLGGPPAHRRPPHPLGGLVAHPPPRAREGPQDPVHDAVRPHRGAPPPRRPRAAAA